MDAGRERVVSFATEGVELEGALAVPQPARGLVLFAHGSGSSRRSPRNNFVARELRAAGLATFLFDLLTEGEDVEYARRFDIRLLTDRLVAATRWVQGQPALAALPLGYFGASTGAAAALEAAARPGARAAAVVSRGGRPDRAGAALAQVRAATLLVVGGRDEVVLELNRRALAQLTGEKELAVVPGATHLFEEPGALEQVARLAARWFERHLAAGP